MNITAQTFETAVDSVRSILAEPTHSAVILGTGMHGLADEIESPQRIAYQSLPGFVAATADGHVGEFVAGRWRGTPILAMNGRFHLYEGYSHDEVILPIKAMAAVGIRNLVISNAAGGLNPRFHNGQVMLIDHHIDLTFCPNKNARLANPQALRPRRQEIYSSDWLQRVVDAAPLLDAPLDLGVYIGLTGPTYETRSEYRYLRKIGGDAVGMSTVCEASSAAALGMQVFGMSIITNVANPDAPSKTTSEGVIQAAGDSGDQVRTILESALRIAHPFEDSRSPSSKP